MTFDEWWDQRVYKPIGSRAIAEDAWCAVTQRVEDISVECPHCAESTASSALPDETSLDTCNRCGSQIEVQVVQYLVADIPEEWWGSDGKPT